jgi:hypothetical protein
MNDDEDCQLTHHPDRVPPLLAINYPIRHNYMQRIIPNAPRQLERDAVLL